MKIKLFGFNVLEFGSLQDPGPDAGGDKLSPPPGDIPSRQTKFLSPRYEPSNITTNSDVQKIQAAIRTAEAGDTQELFRFYRDILLSDDHIAGECNTRTLAVLAQPLAILPEDKNNQDDVMLAKAMMVAKNDCQNWQAGMKALMRSNTMFPVAIVERLYKAGAKSYSVGRPGIPGLKYTLDRFVPVNPQLLCYQWAYMMGGVGLGTGSAIQVGNMPGYGAMPVQMRGQAVSSPKNGEPADPYMIDLERWEPYIKLWPIDQAGRIIYDVTHAEYLDAARHVVHRGHDLAEFRDNWGGPGRSILFWYLFRNLGREWFARGMEGYGSPFKVAYTDVKDPEAVNLLRQAMDLSKKIGGIIVDESSKIELLEAMTSGMSQGYETFYQMCNDAISARLTGLKASKKPAGLNSGEGQFQETVRQDVRLNDQLELGETCKRQLLWPFRDLNGLKGDCKFVWGGLTDADAETFSQLLLNMKQAGYQPTNDSLSTINERTGLSWEIAPAPEAAAPGPGNGNTKQFALREQAHWLMAAGTKGTQRTQGHENPVGDLPGQYSAALGKAFRGTNAPVAKILRDSVSKEDFLRKLNLYYSDFDPSRIVAIAEEALQVAAAVGAVKGAGTETVP